MRKILIAVTVALIAVLAAQEQFAGAASSSVRANSAANYDIHYSPTQWQASEQGAAEDPERNSAERTNTDYSIYAYSREITLNIPFENLNLDTFCDVATQNKLSISTVFTPDGEGAYDGLFQKTIIFKKVKVKMKSIWQCKKKEADSDADFLFKQELYDYSEYTNHGFTIYKFIANGSTTKVIYSGHIAIRKNSYASNQKGAMKKGTDEKIAFLKKTLPVVLKK